MTENTATVYAKKIYKHYKQRKTSFSLKGNTSSGKVKSVDGVSFSLQKGKVLGVIGESGCGKSTLGRVLVNLESPTDGTIYINGKTSEDLYKENKLMFRRTAQIIFQNPFDTFDPRFTIEKILTGALKLHRIGKNASERKEISLDQLKKYGFNPAHEFLDRYPHELSGGQLQRISILRSMLLSPEFIVADEPVSMLDVSIRADVLNMLKKLCEEEETAMVFISHDIAATRYISDEVAVMYLGKIVETGAADDVLHNPKHPYTQALVSNSTQTGLDGSDNVIRLKGEPPAPVDTGPGCYFYDRCPIRKASCQEDYPETIDMGNGHFVSCPYTGELEPRKTVQAHSVK